MKKYFKIIVQVLYVISFVGLIFFGVVGTVCEIIGYAKFERALSAIGISNGFDRTFTISYIIMFLHIATVCMKSKFFK